jgi:hypothetical protein
MTDQTDRELVARRIRALLQKTVDNGCTEEEALLAAEKARELMDQYRLTQSDIEIQAEPIDQTYVNRRQQHKNVSEDYCLGGIKHYCGVKAWFSHVWENGKLVNKLVLFGLRGDCELARWLYEMIGSTIMATTEGYKQATKDDFPPGRFRRQAITDFRMGMAGRINQRLHEMARAMEPIAKTATGTALVVVRTAVVDAAYARLNLNLRATKGRSYRMGDAFARGLVAGDRVTLNRPVSRGKPAGYLS